MGRLLSLVGKGVTLERSEWGGSRVMVRLPIAVKGARAPKLNALLLLEHQVVQGHGALTAHLLLFVS